MVAFEIETIDDLVAAGACVVGRGMSVTRINLLGDFYLD